VRGSAAFIIGIAGEKPRSEFGSADGMLRHPGSHKQARTQCALARKAAFFSSSTLLHDLRRSILRDYTLGHRVAASTQHYSRSARLRLDLATHNRSRLPSKAYDTPGDLYSYALNAYYGMNQVVPLASFGYPGGDWQGTMSQSPSLSRPARFPAARARRSVCRPAQGPGPLTRHRKAACRTTAATCRARTNRRSPYNLRP
jgi:hypothetical protein